MVDHYRGLAPGGSIDTGYDLRGRLTSESEQVSAGGQNYPASGSYSYDLSDNLQEGVSGWTYNSNNQLVSAPAKAGLAGATGLSYDSSGNLTSANGMTFTYDALGEMTQATGTSQGTVSYAYDVLGRRASKTENGVTTEFLWDGDDLVAEWTSAGLTRFYEWGPGGLIEDAASQIGDWASRFDLEDDAGDASVSVDEGGSVSEEQAFTGYMQSYFFQNNGSWSQSIVQGGYEDSETGLVYTGGSGYYAPALGQYATPGAVGFTDGNAYAYGPAEEDADAGILPDGWNGEQFEYNGFRHAVHEGAGYAEEGLNFAASFNPIYQVGEVIGGQDAAGHCLSVGDRLFTAATMMAGPLGKALHGLGGARTELKLAKEVGLAERLCNGVQDGCFVAGTPVQVEEAGSEKSGGHTSAKGHAGRAGRSRRQQAALRPVEEVKEGDLVLSRDPDSGKTEAKRVVRTTVRRVPVVVDLEFAVASTGAVVQKLTSTRNHPFYVRGKGFVRADALGIGSAIVTRAGPDLVVKAVQWQRQAGGRRVYNFEVEDDHSYFVGHASGGVWVHNAEYGLTRGTVDVDGLTHYVWRSPSGQNFDLLLDAQVDGTTLTVNDGHIMPQSGSFDAAKNALGIRGLARLRQDLGSYFGVDTIEVPNQIGRTTGRIGGFGPGTYRIP